MENDQEDWLDGVWFIVALLSGMVLLIILNWMATEWDIKKNPQGWWERKRRQNTKMSVPISNILLLATQKHNGGWHSDTSQQFSILLQPNMVDIQPATVSRNVLQRVSIIRGEADSQQ